MLTLASLQIRVVGNEKLIRTTGLGEFWRPLAPGSYQVSKSYNFYCPATYVKGRYARVFFPIKFFLSSTLPVPGKIFQPGLMSAGRSRAYPNKASFRISTLYGRTQEQTASVTKKKSIITLTQVVNVTNYFS